MIESDKQIKLGELMVKAGYLSSGDVIEAIQVSKRLQIPVGRVLMVSGCIGEDLVQIALQAQILVKEGLITADTGIQALKEVRKGKTLQQALADLNCSPVYESNDHDLLGHLLLDSNIVTQDQLDLALETSSQGDIPLAGALVLQGVLSANFFPALMHTQDQIRRGKVSHEKAVEDLKTSFLMWVKAEESLKRDEETTEEERNQLISEEILIIREADAKRVEAEEEDEEEPEVEEDEAPIAPPKSAYKSADKARPEELPVLEPPSTPYVSAQPSKHERFERQGSDALHLIRDQKTTRLVDLLKAAGVVSQHDIQHAYERMLDDPELCATIFQAMGLIDEAAAQEALRSHSLIEKNLLTQEQAARAIRGSRSGVQPFDEALADETAKNHPFLNKQWRKDTLKRALSGCLIGTLVAGLALGSKRKK